MPAQPALTEREQRIQVLRLRCELDRLNYRLLTKPKPTPPPLEIAGIRLDWLKDLAGYSQLVPGRIGRWARRFSLGHTLFQGIRAATRG